MEIPRRRVHNRRSVSAVSEFGRLSHQKLPPSASSIHPTMSAQHNKVFWLECDGDVLIVVPQGDANGFRYHDVHQESNVTLQVLDDPALKHVVIDFGCEQMLGSIIISVIIKVCRKVGLKGGKAAFCNASPDMQEVLQTMNLTKMWNYHPTRAEAIAAVRAG